MVRVDAECTANGAACPACRVRSNRVHGSYLRFPADVPSAGRSVVLQLRVRRFACRNSECTRRTFVEQIPRSDPSARSANRAAARDAGRGRSRPGGPCRRPPELRARGLRQPEHRPAPGRRPSRAGSARPACGRR
ncbi:transposase family protein [Streptomyces sp. NPDC029080]|uniref:transposase family protein n=1 Tax=Streptomyces sp. NPDC029080 TaxID=3155017 RepID=UPI0033C3AFEA